MKRLHLLGGDGVFGDTYKDQQFVLTLILPLYIQAEDFHNFIVNLPQF